MSRLICVNMKHTLFTDKMKSHQALLGTCFYEKRTWKSFLKKRSPPAILHILHDGVREYRRGVPYPRKRSEKT